MTNYKVIKRFRDLQDNNHFYEVGESYPHSGEVNEERVEELTSSDNKIGEPLIITVNESQSMPTPIDLTKTVDELKEAITVELGEDVLNELLAAETADKNRKGIIEHITDLIEAGE